MAKELGLDAIEMEKFEDAKAALKSAGHEVGFMDFRSKKQSVIAKFFTIHVDEISEEF